MFSRIVKKCWLCHTVKMKFRENKDGATSLGEIDQVNEGAIGLQERPFDHFRVVTRVFLSDRRDLTAGHRLRFTGPVGPVTG